MQKQKIIEDGVEYHVSRKGKSVAYTLPGGIYHRIKGPAITTSSGTEVWIQNGELHREDGPAYYVRSPKANCGVEDGWFLFGVNYGDGKTAPEKYTQALRRLRLKSCLGVS